MSQSHKTPASSPPKPTTLVSRVSSIQVFHAPVSASRVASVTTSNLMLLVSSGRSRRWLDTVTFSCGGLRGGRGGAGTSDQYVGKCAAVRHCLHACINEAGRICLPAIAVPIAAPN